MRKMRILPISLLFATHVAALAAEQVKHNIGGGRIRQRTLKNGEKHKEHHDARAETKMVGATQHYKFGPDTTPKSHTHTPKEHKRTGGKHTKQDAIDEEVESDPLDRFVVDHPSSGSSEGDANDAATGAVSGGEFRQIEADVTTTDVTICEFCPDGLTAGRDFVMPTGDNATCGMAQDFAASVPPDNPACVTIQLAQTICCPTPEATTTAAPIATEAATTEAASTELPTTAAIVVTVVTEPPAIDEGSAPVEQDPTSVPATSSPEDTMVSKASKANHKISTKSAKAFFAKAHKEHSAKASKEEMSLHHKSSKTSTAKMDKNPMAKTHKEASTKAATTPKAKGEGKMSMHISAKSAKAEGIVKKAKVQKNHFAKVHKEPTTPKKKEKGGDDMSMHNKGSHAKSSKASAKAVKKDASKMSAKSSKSKAHKMETGDTKAHKVSPEEAGMYKSKQSKRAQKGDTTIAAATVPSKEVDDQSHSMSLP